MREDWALRWPSQRPESWGRCGQEGLKMKEEEGMGRREKSLVRLQLVWEWCGEVTEGWQRAEGLRPNLAMGTQEVLKQGLSLKSAVL